MPGRDERAHVFVVRIWFEPREIAGATPPLRGTVQHVESGEQRAITELGDVTAFIAGRLGSVDTKPSCRTRLRNWLDRWIA